MSTSTQQPSVGPLTRRTFIAGTASVAGVGVLAACAPGTTETPATQSQTPAAGGDDAAAALVSVADVPVGGSVSATTASGDPVIVSQPEEGTIVAFSAICTHQGCTVAPDGPQLKCPCHGSVYESGTGGNVSGPAPSPLPAFAVEVKDGQVVEA
jgi:cytochrome b6-f complex iron-sulfur subunit